MLVVCVLNYINNFLTASRGVECCVCTSSAAVALISDSSLVW